MNAKEIRHVSMGSFSGIKSARARLTKPILFLLVLLALDLFLATAVMAARFYRDADSDGYGNPSVYVDRRIRPSGYVTNSDDCNDANSAIHPGVQDVCDSVDNDCDGTTDEGCVTWYRDSDNDLHGNPAVSTVSLVQPAGYVVDNTDCDDTNSAVFSGATEFCDTLDNDCDGSTDEGCVPWYRDLDGDGYGNLNVSQTANSRPPGYVADSSDCNDSDAAIFPGATEVCDGKDNDCDSSVDEGCQSWYQDGDGDGYGNPAISQQAVGQPAGFVSGNTDCDDADAAINPGAAEVCDTGHKDENCNGLANEGCQTWYQDGDGDGYGNAAVSVSAFAQPAGYVGNSTDCDDTDAGSHPGALEVTGDGHDNDCDGETDESLVWYWDGDGDGYGDAANTSVVAAPGYVLNNMDCDDTNAAANPGATEVCDNVDNNCNGVTDEGCQIFYHDNDHDGYGDPAASVADTNLPAGYVNSGTDCDDSDAAVNPDAFEVCADSKDNDCDGTTDEGCQLWYVDNDGDGFGNPAVSVSASVQPTGYVGAGTDCDDTNAAISPGAREVCDEVDNNCNGFVDEGCIQRWYQDNDGDTFGNPAVSYTGEKRDGYVLVPGDCDDTRISINPDAPEVCNDGIDNNCAGGVDEGCLEWYLDADGDTYGNPGVSVNAVEQPAGFVADSSDCNDSNAAAHPGAEEACDGMDSDCDGSIDEGCQAWYQDADGDGYGNPAVSTEAIMQPAGYVNNDDDCDDTKASINPGAEEACDDGEDNDCDGSTDEGCMTWYQDADGDTFGNPDVSDNTGDQPAGYVERAGDCDDTRADINPDQAEVCDDGTDNNCAGGVDEGCVRWYRDNDGDTFGTADYVMAIGQPAGFAARSGDCNDANAAVNPDATEICDGIDNDCDGDRDEGCVRWYRDSDDDTYGDPAVSFESVSQPAGFVGMAGDCNDTDAAIHPGVAEVCDGGDNDCDGIVDEGCMLWYRDADGDTYGDAGVSSNANAQPAGYVNGNTDCDDTSAAVNPGAPEVCGDGIDNNCSGDADEGCLTWYRDADGDGYGNPGVSTVSSTQPAGFVRDGMDCDDTDSLVHPGAVEVCDGIKDDNCDGAVDEGCVAWHQDADDDGYGNAAVSMISIAQPAGYVLDRTDCDDTNAAVNPGLTEVCDDGLDNNCAGGVDEGCLTWYQDADGDHYGNAGVSITAITPPAGYVFDRTDCDDGDPGVHPGAMEVCDGLDNNCAGGTDEGCLAWYRDADGDNYGNAGVSMTSLTQPPGYVPDNTDCNDANPGVNPGAAEICDSWANDEDCDGSWDENCQWWYQDADGDNYGNNAIWLVSQTAPPGYVLDWKDCDDTNPAINPSAVEICGDGLDNNCNWNIDEGCVTWYQDGDGDNYGNSAVSVVSETQPAGYVMDGTDCDDTDPLIHPGATEVCDGINDEDCDGAVDERCLVWYQDGDGDGYGNAGVTLTAVDQTGGYVAVAGDCDDTNPGVNPGVAEVCGDGLDNNCDGGTDEGCLVWYQDSDGDNYGNAGVSQSAAYQPPGFVPDNTDCDDTNPLKNPGMSEKCGDGIDNDCDGNIDDISCVNWFKDVDGDTYGDPTQTTMAVGQPAGYVSRAGDCDDGNAAVNPGVPEVCGDAIDNNCNGSQDEGCVIWYQDGDGDNYGNAGSFVTSIIQPPGYVPDSTDCDDGNAAVNPGQTEVCGDGLDNDCAGGADNGCQTWYQDGDGDNYGNPSVWIVSVTRPPGYVEDRTDCDDANPAVHPGAQEVCDNWMTDEDCDGVWDEGCQGWCQDADGDTFGNSAVWVNAMVRPPGYVYDWNDCDDTNAAIHPGVPELCDGIDNNCNWWTDETCVTWYEDADGDNYGNSAVSVVAIVQPAGYVADGTDCDDTNAGVNPGMAEVCADGLDNDCFGGADNGCLTWYPDSDGDNFGGPGAPMDAIVQPAGYVSDDTDCDDTNTAVHPGAMEVCGDGLDNDCLDGADNGCLTWYQDSDGDNYGNAGVALATVIQPPGYVSDGTDCDDTNAGVNPGMAEVCGDGLDNDCAGGVDDGCQVWYLDNDSDSYGDPAVSTQSAIRPAGYVSNNMDCDDARAFVNPGATEICDGIDNNCVGGIDEGCTAWYRDNDGDNFGSAVSTRADLQPAGYAALPGDCNDANAAINPGVTEVCGDGVDNDCDGGLDEGCVRWYRDSDGDAYGDPAVSVDAVSQPAGYVAAGTDCDDNDAAVNPGAVEVCDGVDNDCDGGLDEGCVAWYQDNDADGYGNDAVTTIAVTQPAGYAGRGGDCNDADTAVNPAAVEICDGADNDCDGRADEGCVAWYQDLDGDTYGDSAIAVTAVLQPLGFAARDGDCEDSNAAVNPGVTEVCGDGVDNDCDGSADEGCITWYQDLDGDNYGLPGAVIEAVTRPDDYTDRGGDCNDADSDVNPGVAEVCDDGIDNDCDGSQDEGCADWYQDNDGDGYGSVHTISDFTRPPGYVAVPGDCNDADAAIHKGVRETCDGIDNDCDGAVDEGCIFWYQDLDGDKFGNPEVYIKEVSQPAGYVAAGGDCDDANPAIRPFVLDLCDHLDNDCDFASDEDVPKEDYKKTYQDYDGDGYGNPGVYVEDCMLDVGYVIDASDCNDKDADVHPEAFDVCDNGIDEDCSGADRPCGTTATRGCANIAAVPLETQVDSAPPIVMLLLDNSGSMSWNVMCPGEADGLYKGYSDCTTGNNEYWQAQYSGKNTIYYNPNVEYTPWPNYSNANKQRPRQHPDASPTTDLDSKFETFSGAGGIDVKVAHYYAWSSTEQRPYLVFVNNSSVTYYRINPPADNELDANHVTGPVAASAVPNDAIIPQAWKDGNRECSAAEADAARQNFANWYQYYRTRMLTAINTLVSVVSNVSGIKLGVTTINVNSASGFFEPVLVDDKVDTASGHDGPANRQSVIDFILESGVPNGGTPLLRTYRSLGDYFDNAAHDSRPSPWASEEEGGECQMAFIILMTDGYYNGANPGIDDEDGNQNTAFDGPPFADAYGQGDTLADMAMYYYERDLATELDDNVPTTANDTARHQHVVTYSISFGVIGTLDPKAYAFNSSSTGCLSGATCTAAAPCNCVPYWPYIPQKDEGCLEKIDDLYHASVNGRGKYFATSNVRQLSYALSTILNEISDRRGSGASVAVSTQELTEDTQLYRAFFNTSGWFGELGSWKINLDGSINPTPTWLAAGLLDARDLSADPRTIFTYNPDVPSGVPFELGNLSPEQKKFLGTTDGERQRLIDFLKGDRSQEEHNGGPLRDRVSRLGDIVHSAPVHVMYADGNDYLYVGGNDGMLHAFDAASTSDGGQEVFAYIPSLVYENLAYLSDPDYRHRYYVDTTPFIDSTGLLIGGLGAGGKGYFALDVTSPGTFNSSDVLWEYPPGIDNDMGFSFAKPIVVPHQYGRLAIFGNGYDSKNGRAVLYVLTLDANNAIVEVRKIDTLAGSQSGDPEVTTGCNGLSSTMAADVNYDNLLDFIYAGDMQGNLWKFDLTAPTSLGWKVAYGTAEAPQPLFKAEYEGVPQPIYAKPSAMRHCLANREGYIVVFGTGKFFAQGDHQDTSQQTIYGVWDWAEELETGDIVDPKNYPLGAPSRKTDYAELPVLLGGSSPVTFALQGQSAGSVSGIFSETSAIKLYDKYKDPNGIPNDADDQRAWFDADTWQANGAGYTGVRYAGWYLDLPNTGERVIADTTIRSGLAIMVSLDPSPAPCKPGGNSFLMLVRACDGSNPEEEVLDTNDDGVIDDKDDGSNREELPDIVYKPVFVEGDNTKMFFDEKKGKEPPSEHLGVAYWQFLRVLHE
ncbi:MAG: PilC/PilY family type IV pilus protein [Thermodesulfobacteriota bacterium]